MARCQSCCATERKLHGDAGDVAAYFKNLKCNIIRLAIHICGDSGENDGMVTDKIEYCGGYNTEGINKFIDEFLKELSFDKICSVEFTPQTLSQIVSVLSASIETRAWKTFDNTINHAEKLGIHNPHIDMLIEESYKFR